MRVAVEFTLEARVFCTNHERGAHLTGRTGVHGSDGGVVSFAESHRSIVAIHHQEGGRIEIGADQARRSEIGSTFRRDDAFKQVQGPESRPFSPPPAPGAHSETTCWGR